MERQSGVDNKMETDVRGLPGSTTWNNAQGSTNAPNLDKIHDDNRVCHITVFTGKNIRTCSLLWICIGIVSIL